MDIGHKAKIPFCIFQQGVNKYDISAYTIKISVTLHPMWWQLNCHCYWCNIFHCFEIYALFDYSGPVITTTMAGKMFNMMQLCFALIFDYI